jgi:acetyltransferase-like isoleucine patch superfamily enzyme
MFNIFNGIYNYVILKIFNVSIRQKYKIKGRLFIRNRGSIIIGKNLNINSGITKNPIGSDTITRLVCRKGGEILIGNNVGISNSTIVSSCGVTISDNVLIGGGCRIWDTNFHSLIPSERESHSEKNIKSRRIQINANSFIGGGSIILLGVTVGKNSVVGAGSVVRDNIPDNQIWAGNPAVKIRDLN